MCMINLVKVEKRLHISFQAILVEKDAMMRTETLM